MITKEWCKDYALINQGLNADNIFPVAWFSSTRTGAYPHAVVGDSDFIVEANSYSSWGTLITVPVQTLPTVDVSNCNVSVRRATLDAGLSLTAVPFQCFMVHHFLNLTASTGYFIPAGAYMNGPLSFAFAGNFNRLAQIIDSANKKSTAYVFPYVLVGNLTVSGTSQQDLITLTNQDVNRINDGTSLTKFGQNRVFNLTEVLDYVPCVFDAMKIEWSSTKSLSFVGYAIQKNQTSYQNTRTALFTQPA